MIPPCACTPRASLALEPLQYLQIAASTGLGKDVSIETEPILGFKPKQRRRRRRLTCSPSDVPVKLCQSSLKLLQQRQVALERRQVPHKFGLLPAEIFGYFLFAAKPKVISGRGLALLRMGKTEIRLQSKTATARLPDPRLALPRPLHQLLLLLTKVPAAQSQGEEVVLLEVVEYPLPQLLRELVQTPGVLDFTLLALVLRPAP